LYPFPRFSFFKDPVHGVFFPFSHCSPFFPWYSSFPFPPKFQSSLLLKVVFILVRFSFRFFSPGAYTSLLNSLCQSFLSRNATPTFVVSPGYPLSPLVNFHFSLSLRSSPPFPEKPQAFPSILSRAGETVSRPPFVLVLLRPSFPPASLVPPPYHPCAQIPPRHFFPFCVRLLHLASSADLISLAYRFVRLRKG